MRSMLAEAKLGAQDLASVLTSIASFLNDTSLKRLERNSKEIPRSPLEVMTGILPQWQVLRILPTRMNQLEARTFEHARALQVMNIDYMHKDLKRSVFLCREIAINAHNKATNIIQPQFTISDFVLFRRATDRGHKIQFRWFGPCRITAVYSPLVYGASPLRDGKTDRFHCARPITYKDSLLGKPVP